MCPFCLLHLMMYRITQWIYISVLILTNNDNNNLNVSPTYIIIKQRKDEDLIIVIGTHFIFLLFFE